MLLGSPLNAAVQPVCSAAHCLLIKPTLLSVPEGGYWGKLCQKKPYEVKTGDIHCSALIKKGLREIKVVLEPAWHWGHCLPGPSLS